MKRHNVSRISIFCILIVCVSITAQMLSIRLSETSNANKNHSTNKPCVNIDSLGNTNWKEFIRFSDSDNDGISDNFELELIREMPDSPITVKEISDEVLLATLEGRSTIKGQTPINLNSLGVIVNFPPGNIDDEIEVFSGLGGKIKKVFTDAITGFAGTISFSALEDFCAILREKSIPFLIEEDAIVQSNLYYASRNMNLRPLEWSSYGFRGDPSTAVAVIDSGIDDSHSAFAPGYSANNQNYKLTGWIDEVNGNSMPYDDNGHGSHCAGIIAGSGGYALDGSNRSTATYSQGYNYTGYYIPNRITDVVAARFNVTTTGTISIDCQFLDSTSGDRVYISAYLYCGDTLIDSHVSTATSWNDTLNYTAINAYDLGEYSFRLRIQFYGIDYDCNNPIWNFRGIVHWPFNPPSLGTSNFWQGVAPDSRLVGIKVLGSDGSGSVSDIIAGVNWAIANKLTFNITVISMSLGGAAGYTSLISAVNNAVNSGIVTVVAAGNDGAGANHIGSPGDADNVITVAAMSDSDHVTEYSSQGGNSYTGITIKPDILAPGGSSYNFSIFSADTNDNDAGTYLPEGVSNDLAPAMGTSMAAPAVAGAANLVIDALGGRQNWNYSGSEAKLVKALLLMTATETYPLQRESDTTYSPLLNRGGKDVHEGYGRLNVDTAIEACRQDLWLSHSITETVYSSASGAFNKHAMGAYIDLIAGVPYTFTLNMTASVDCDLHLYSGSASATGEPVLLASSKSSTVGAEELIIYTPTTSGRYYIVAKAISGSGIITLGVFGDDYSPTLSNPSLFPISGNTGTAFNFNIDYADADNNAPFTIRVFINGTSHIMNKINSTDKNYVDGCTFTYIHTLGPGNHEYYFSAYDGRFTVNTTSFIGPNVTNEAPILTNGSLTPTSGTIDTIFTYRVVYTDADNNMPSIIQVEINTNFYTMIKENSSDNNYVDGCAYVYSRKMVPGSHIYCFYAVDGYAAFSTSYESGPQVVNTPATITCDMVSPSTGTTDVTYIYSFIYTDAENNAPVDVRVYIDGTPYTMTKQNSSDANYTDGCTYIYSRKLTPTSHNYYFYANDGNSIITTNTVVGPIVVNNSPTLTSISVDPPSGSPTTVFIFSVVYTDIDNNAPSGISVNIDGDYHALSKYNSSDSNYTDGCRYTYSRLLSPTAHTYNFGASDGYASTTTVTYSGPLVTNNPPTLTNVSVNPATGSIYTTFTYLVTYTDFENVQPSYIHVCIDGTYYTMIKQNASDFRFSDGCIYYYSTVLSPTAHTYFIGAGDGYADSTTLTYANPSVTDNPPILTSGMVTPGVGNTATTFIFSVVYADMDNDIAATVWVCIDGASPNPMTKQISTDNNYTDGCVYTYSRTLGLGSHNFYYYACDGYLATSTGIISGPNVISINTVPSLSSGTVFPSAGNNRTTFIYHVIYSDPENVAPSSISVVVDGVVRSMSKQNSSDNNYVDGCTYIFTSTNPIGTHNFFFNTSDNALSTSTALLSGPIVSAGNSAPSLGSFSVSPTVGNTQTNFIFRVIYTDSDNNAPSTVFICLDGYSYLSMVKENSSDYIFTDGCVYIGTRTATIGSHNYRFDANDGYGWIQTGTFSGPSVQYINTFCTLTSGSVTPGMGSSTTAFTYSVIYTDAENNAPSSISAIIDGTLYAMSKQNINDENYRDGCTYIYTRTLVVGEHDYRFYAEDGYSGSCTTTTSNGPWVINRNPTLTSGSVTPTTGNTLTTFVYSVTYTDLDDNVPSYVRVNIDGTQHTMSKQTSADYIFSDGCVYVYSCTLALGTSHYYSFTASDGTITRTTSTVFNPYVINHSPTLTFGSVSPTSGTPSTYFSYSVTYTDSDNNAPSYVRAYIDGTYYNMWKWDSSDYNYEDGCVYMYNRYLSVGSHTYYFRTSDGFDTISTTSISGPAVFSINTAPTITSIDLSPSSGTTSTSFRYSLVYTDAENVEPTYVRVYIDGTQHVMSKQNVGDVVYSDGCVYEYFTLLAEGTHNFYFTTSDGSNSVTTSTYSDPLVIPANIIPTLSSGSVSPATGSTYTYFSFIVSYTDLNNEAPAYVYIIIDGISISMKKQQAGDNYYTDGCLYFYGGYLASGVHEYYFCANDGTDTVYTSTVYAPTVTIASNTVPSLSSASVFPVTGTPSTVFSFSITYADVENSTPVYIQLIIDGVVHNMIKQVSSDNNLTDGCVYIFQTTLSSGDHDYYFRTNDSFDETTTGHFSGPVVNLNSSNESDGAVIWIIIGTIGGIVGIGIIAKVRLVKSKKNNPIARQRRPNPKTKMRPTSLNAAPPTSYFRKPSISDNTIENIGALVDGTVPIIVNGKSFDINGDLRNQELVPPKRSWIDADVSDFDSYFNNIVLEMARNVIGGGLPRTAIFTMIRAMSIIFFGDLKADKRDAHDQEVAFNILRTSGAVDINTQAPHLTYPGYVVRSIVMQLNCEQAKFVQSMNIKDS